MARPWRIQYPDATYHVMSRGNDGSKIFLGDRDRLDFLELMGRTCDRFDLRVLAFCLMGNHFHLFVQTPSANLAQAMKWLNSTYALRFNLRHRRHGHLLSGRYCSVLVHDPSHWLHLSLYIHLNPLRAGLVEDPAQWEWSSFRDYLAARPRFDWLDRDPILSVFGGSGRQPRRRYRAAAVEMAGLKAEFWEELIHQMQESAKEKMKALISRHPPAGKKKSVPEFRRAMKAEVEVKDVLARIGEAFGVSATELLQPRRGFVPRLAAYSILVERFGFKVMDVAELMGVGPSAVSMGMKKFRRLLASDHRLPKAVRTLIEK